MDSKMLKAYKRFMHASAELSQVWDNDQVVDYPKYLPSFDEFVYDISYIMCPSN